MWVDFRSVYTEKRFILSEIFYKKSPFIHKGVFFFVLFSSMFFIVPYGEAEDATSGTEILIEERSIEEQKQDEYCYWQGDVETFFSLYSKKKEFLQTMIPCGMKIPDNIISSNIKDTKQYDNELETRIDILTTDYPIRQMTKIIATYDPEVVGLIIGIAKKESNWGKRVPVDASGKDCFNYWGYKGAGTRGTAMGHGCFGSPEEAVKIVGDRLRELVRLHQTSEPRNMIIWKCGSSCAGHSDESVRKWISDVSLYYYQIVPRSITYSDR